MKLLKMTVRPVINCRRGLSATIVLSALLGLVGAGALAAPASASGVYPTGCRQHAHFENSYTGDWCWIGTNNSTYDRYSDYAVMAQRILKVDGWYSGYIDGDYGSMTASSVSSYQSNRGLYVDGITGGATWNKLMNTSIQSCGTINHGDHTTLGYRIGTETCGRYIQQMADEDMATRAYNNYGTSPYDEPSWFVLPRLLGPTAL